MNGTSTDNMPSKAENLDAGARNDIPVGVSAPQTPESALRASTGLAGGVPKIRPWTDENRVRLAARGKNAAILRVIASLPRVLTCDAKKLGQPVSVEARP